MFKLKSKFDYNIPNRPSHLITSKLFPYILYIIKIKKEYLISSFNMIGSGVIFDKSKLEYHHHFKCPIIKDTKTIIHSFDENYDTDHYPSIIIDNDKQLVSSTDRNNNLYISDISSKEILFTINLNQLIFPSIIRNNNKFCNKEIININDKKYFYFRLNTESGFRIMCMSSDNNNYNFTDLKVCNLTTKYQNCYSFHHFKYKMEDYLLAKFIDNNSEVLMTLKLITPYQFEEVDIMFTFQNSSDNLEIVGYDPYNKNKFSIKINETLLNLAL
jgi:hypothetical protein